MRWKIDRNHQKNRSGGYKRVVNGVFREPIDKNPTEITRLNPPRQEFRVIHGTYWEKVVDHPNWVGVGYVPTPKTSFYAFVYHFCMGALMHYPLLSILRFCLRKRSLRPWHDEPMPTKPRSKIKKVSKKFIRGWYRPVVKSSPIAIHIYG